MATENNSSQPDFRFDYKKYETKTLTVEKLDQIFDNFNSPSTSLFSQIIIIVKLAAFSLYLWTRRSLIHEQELIQKQEYEVSRSGSQRGDIEEDNLDQH